MNLSVLCGYRTLSSEWPFWPEMDGHSVTAFNSGFKTNYFLIKTGVGATGRAESGAQTPDGKHLSPRERDKSFDVSGLIEIWSLRQCPDKGTVVTGLSV